MESTKRVTLRSTDNPNFANLVGKEGDLSVGQDGKFYFRFQDAGGKVQTLASGIVGCMGSLDLPASKEVCFQTRNSTYVFEKNEKEMGLFSYEQSAKEKIPYSEYDALRQTVAGFQRGDYQRLTRQEVSAVIERWNAVNEAIQNGSAEIVADSIGGKDSPLNAGQVIQQLAECREKYVNAVMWEDFGAMEQHKADFLSLAQSVPEDMKQTVMQGVNQCIPQMEQFSMKRFKAEAEAHKNLDASLSANEGRAQERTKGRGMGGRDYGD